MTVLNAPQGLEGASQLMTVHWTMHAAPILHAGRSHVELPQIDVMHNNAFAIVPLIGRSASGSD